MSKIRLYTPGPTPVSEEVQLAIAAPMDHHRTKGYQQLLAEVTRGLQYVLRTKNTCLTFTSSGTGAMEGAIVSCAVPGKKALVANGGKFGERWVDLCQAFDIPCIPIEVEWGYGVDPEVIKEYLDQDGDIGMVITTHCETSTASVTDIEGIANVVRNSGALYLVDAISSAGALPIQTDQWGIDIVVTGSQKALMTPPGLAFAAVSERAWAVIDSHKPKAYYFDYRAYRNSLAKNDAPYTPALTLVRGVHKALEMIEETGIENIWARTALLARACCQAAKAIGLEIYSNQPSDSVTAICIPDGIDEAAFRKALREQFGVLVAGGQGHLKGKIFRITTMGFVDQIDLIGCISAVEKVLYDMGHKFTPGAAVAAAQKVFCQVT